MNLSEHFTKEEFEYSDTAKARKISNVMNSTQIANAKHFCIYVLENIRKLFNEKYGKACICITSGFRGNNLNCIVGGSNTSQHCCNNGCAASDIYVYKFINNKKTQIPTEQVYKDIKEWVKQGKVSVDQLILEVTKTAKWVHIGTKGQLNQNRKQFLKYNGISYITDQN